MSMKMTMSTEEADEQFYRDTESIASPALSDEQLATLESLGMRRKVAFRREAEHQHSRLGVFEPQLRQIISELSTKILLVDNGNMRRGPRPITERSIRRGADVEQTQNASTGGDFNVAINPKCGGVLCLFLCDRRNYHVTIPKITVRLVAYRCSFMRLLQSLVEKRRHSKFCHRLPRFGCPVDAEFS
jgi:hypothetical protein